MTICLFSMTPWHTYSYIRKERIDEKEVGTNTDTIGFNKYVPSITNKNTTR